MKLKFFQKKKKIKIRTFLEKISVNKYKRNKKWTNIQDFDMALWKVSNVRSQFLVYKLRLLPWKTYPVFVTINQFLQDLQLKQLLRQPDRQTLNCRMATRLTMVPPEKKHLSNPKKLWKSGGLLKNYRWTNINIHINIYVQTNCIIFLPF